MENFICNYCKLIFKSKFSLDRHQNKKNKCDKQTNYKCSKCNKYFKEKRNLTQHIEKDICKIPVIESNTLNIDKNNIESIIESNCSIQDKIFFLKTLGVKMDDIAISKILESVISVPAKVACLNNNINTKNVPIINNTNTNSNNTTNNILINNFGNENVDYIANKSLLKLIKNNYSEDIFLKLSDEIYLNEKHPENQTIKINNLNNKFCKVKEKNKWITTTKDAALKKIFDRVFDIVINCIDETETEISEEKINIINGYIEKDFNDELVIEAVKKLALNIYNFYNSSVI